jgi:hypothetical protein
VSFDDFDEFKGDDPEAAEPVPGDHTATLVRGVVNNDRETGRAKWVVLEWQTTDLACYWTSFHGVSKQAKIFTKRALSKLGIDLDAMTGWADVGDALAAAEGTAYVVRVSRNGKYLNTEVVDRPDAYQTELPVAVPSTPKPATDFDDEDVPF